jgi:hypothetical protein
VGTAPAARPEAAANRHTAPAHHPLATRAATPPHQYGGYLLTDASGHLASTTNKFSSTDSKQQQTRRQPLTAAQATKRQPLQWAATSSQREAKAAHLIINTYLPANSIAHNGHSQARTRRSRLLVADAGFGRGQRLATCQILPTEDGTGVALDKTTIAAERAYFGTAIDLLSPRWPITEPYFALPDSLRPVALAAHPAPTDSLLPRPLVRPYRLQLGLVAAPELSTVRTAHLSPPGTNVGVQLDYRLARRWRLSTAFLYSVKRYGAAGTDYTVPYTMPHGWVIDDVNAVCRIIDIPLNLRYDLWQRSRYQVFASAGLSSLFMKREQYTYDYAPVYGKPVAPYSFEVSNGSRHLLKVLNLSAGYERLLSPRWSVQAEAFAKLPLAGVGYGAVRLRSAGVFFSLRYGLLPGRPAQVPGLR